MRNVSRKILTWMFGRFCWDAPLCRSGGSQEAPSFFLFDNRGFAVYNSLNKRGSYQKRRGTICRQLRGPQPGRDLPFS